MTTGSTVIFKVALTRWKIGSSNAQSTTETTGIQPIGKSSAKGQEFHASPGAGK
jgi:hypothetical protein